MLMLNVTQEDIELAKRQKSNPIQTALKRRAEEISPYTTVEVSISRIVIGAAVYPRVPEAIQSVIRRFREGVELRPFKTLLHLARPEKL